MAAAGSLLAAADADDFLRDMGVQPVSAQAARPEPPPAAAARAGSVADLMSFDDDPELVNLNNPRDRKSRFPTTRYLRVY